MDIPLPDPAAPLDAQACRRARLARDPRFDGEFFVAVRTTGIYCRPVCPARAPAERNVHYYRSAAQAAGDGFRPCLRCRPESAPDSPAWNGTSTTVRRALQLIREGALNDAGLPRLAARLGVGERYLRKLFQREMGVAPSALALNQRLLFAKKLLAETAMPVTEVAFAAGFGSVRRFNSALRSHFRLTPGELRRHDRHGLRGSQIRLLLQYRPPYDWAGVTAFFARHAIDGVEAVDGECYRRRLGGSDSHSATGWMTLRHVPRRHALELELELPDQRLLLPTVARVRRMFDLDANPAAIAAVLAQEPHMRPLIEHCPGVRAPGFWSLYEAALRAIVGQQVSTGAARGILHGLGARAPGDGRILPGGDALLGLPDDRFPMPARRRQTLRALGALKQERGEGLQLDDVAALAGVGPWTVAMAGMRGLGDPDRLPLSDLGITRAWARLAGDRDLAAHARAWRPWRSYAANLLWRSLTA